MQPNTSMLDLKNSSSGEQSIRVLMDYLAKLRDEILQAQKLRMQAMAGKIVFLGGLFSYFLQHQSQNLAILVCPFVALLFDYMIYGFSYNIQVIGAYISNKIEKELSNQTGLSQSIFWESSWAYTPRRMPWGRFFARASNYGITLLTGIVSFTSVSINATIATLISFATILYLALLIFEIKIKFSGK
jgi:hypothetical protein